METFVDRRNVVINVEPKETFRNIYFNPNTTAFAFVNNITVRLKKFVTFLPNQNRTNDITINRIYLVTVSNGKRVSRSTQHNIIFVDYQYGVRKT